MYLVRSRLNPFNAQLIEMSRDLKNIIERYNILTLTRNGLNMRTKMQTMERDSGTAYI